MVRNRVKELRLARGMSQTDLARLCECHTTTISKIESGRNRLTPARKPMMAGALGVQIWELTRAPEPSHPFEQPVDMPQAAAPVAAPPKARPGKIGPPKNLPEGECDVALDEMERMILRVWRLIPPEGKDHAIIAMAQWADRVINPAASRTG